jgi:Holliday junction DNA helicase RuvA
MDYHLTLNWPEFIERYWQKRPVVLKRGIANFVDPISGMSAPQFVNAVEREDPAALIKLPGIGKKTAERLIVEMKDRFKGLHGDLFTPAADLVLTSPSAPTTDDAEQEAVAALVALGYKPQEASRMVSKIAKPDANSETLIREALRAAL